MQKIIDQKKKDFLDSLEMIHMDYKDQTKLAEYKSEYNSILSKYKIFKILNTKKLIIKKFIYQIANSHFFR